jgi:hypothetical protein
LANGELVNLNVGPTRSVVVVVEIPRFSYPSWYSPIYHNNGAICGNPVSIGGDKIHESLGVE